ncbi:uncharacterized protein UDID_19559 [Ustilago sp. UG-2017a]|nr:uncharacterized protein UDID_19559 [Ustilago sp. UG-2017a]
MSVGSDSSRRRALGLAFSESLLRHCLSNSAIFGLDSRWPDAPPVLENFSAIFGRSQGPVRMNGLRRCKALKGAARLADGDTAERKGRQRLDSDSLKVMQSERIIKRKDQLEAQARVVVESRHNQKTRAEIEAQRFEFL